MRRRREPRSHDCPLCCQAGVSPRAVACAPCWGALPQRLRAPLITAWAGRERYPATYSETLATTLLWRRDLVGR